MHAKCSQTMTVANEIVHYNIHNQNQNLVNDTTGKIHLTVNLRLSTPALNGGYHKQKYYNNIQ